MAGVLGAFSGCGDGFLIMLPAPGRSANPVRDDTADVRFCGDSGFGVSVGMPDVGGREVMTTSSGLAPLLLGRSSGEVA